MSGGGHGYPQPLVGNAFICRTSPRVAHSATIAATRSPAQQPLRWRSHSRRPPRAQGHRGFRPSGRDAGGFAQVPAGMLHARSSRPSSRHPGIRVPVLPLSNCTWSPRPRRTDMEARLARGLVAGGGRPRTGDRTGVRVPDQRGHEDQRATKPSGRRIHSSMPATQSFSSPLCALSVRSGQNRTFHPFLAPAFE